MMGFKGTLSGVVDICLVGGPKTAILLFWILVFFFQSLCCHFYYVFWHLTVIFLAVLVTRLPR